jgi:hypothetical protein
MSPANSDTISGNHATGFGNENSDTKYSARSTDTIIREMTKRMSRIRKYRACGFAGAGKQSRTGRLIGRYQPTQQPLGRAMRLAADERDTHERRFQKS